MLEFKNCGSGNIGDPNMPIWLKGFTAACATSTAEVLLILIYF